MGQIPFFPIEASTQAWQTDALMLLLLGLSAFFTLIVVALIIFWGLRYRRGRPADRSNPPTHNTRMEISWMVGLLVLSAITYVLATKVYFDMANPPKDAMDVYVVGLQWMWKFQHPEGQQEINELHVPVGVPVRLVMTSQDVIHSLFIPDFRIKHDVIPGRYVTVWFQATQVGQYHLFCTQYCGTNHSRMIGTVYVMQPADYAAWLAGGTTTAAAAAPSAAGAAAGTSGGASATTSLAQAGQQLFNTMGCANCHAPGSGTIGPNLVGLFGKAVPLSNGTSVTADENYIRESILNPSAKIVAGYQNDMPTFQGRLTEEQILQLIAFIKSLGSQSGSSPSGSGNAPAGAGTPASAGGGTPAP